MDKMTVAAFAEAPRCDGSAIPAVRDTALFRPAAQVFVLLLTAEYTLSSAKVPLVAGKTVEIPSSSAYALRAVGGQGMDFLKLFVIRGEFAFPPDGAQSWYSTPEEPERVAELAALLKRLEGQQWESVAAPLHIVK